MNTTTPSITTYELATLIANLAEEKKAKDITLLETEQVTSLADYFIIASVESRTQMKALADHIIKYTKSMNLQLVGQELDKGGRWTLLDLGDVVIHLFHQEDRSFYSLERFWSHANEVPRSMWLQEKRQAS